MSLTNFWAVILTVIAMSVLSSRCPAFEVDGFVSGMSETESLEVARRFDEHPSVEKDIDGEIQIFLSRNDDGSLIKYDLTICNNSLVRVTKSGKFDWNRLHDLVARLNDLYGDGELRAEKADYGDVSYLNFGDVNRVSSVGVSLRWTNDEDFVVVHTGLVETTYKQKPEAEVRERIFDIYGMRSYSRSMGCAR